MKLRWAKKFEAKSPQNGCITEVLQYYEDSQWHDVQHEWATSEDEALWSKHEKCLAKIREKEFNNSHR